jgi:hypothetical protein
MVNGNLMPGSNGQFHTSPFQDKKKPFPTIVRNGFKAFFPKEF